MAAIPQFLFYPCLRLDDSAADLSAGLVHGGGGRRHCGADSRRVRRLLPRSDSGQPDHLRPNQLDRRRPDPLRADEPILLRPIPPIYDALASEFAGKVVYLVFDLPILAVLALILRPEMDFRLENGLAFIPALVLAWALRFFWGYWLALLAFWATRADALLALQDSLIFLLAGQVAPIVLLPDAMQTAAKILPFRYMVAFPVEVLTNQLSAPDLLTGFVAQIGWLVFAFALYAVLWRVGVRRYSAIGG
ncbi:MAG: ABC-2 family transporter protein [Chloroflexi bacterium]|nr:ABC-2 family transporter protein [Chloroflexota bacterium]